MGFRDLRDMGLIPQVPKLLEVTPRVEGPSHLLTARALEVQLCACSFDGGDTVVHTYRLPRPPAPKNCLAFCADGVRSGVSLCVCLKLGKIALAERSRRARDGLRVGEHRAKKATLRRA
mgnify:CR=1 FL=1